MLDRQREAGLEIVSDLALADATSGRQELDAELETTVYRIVQEALTNVAKHARAGSVRVSVARQDGELVIQVQDNGVGFDAAAPTSGFGLAGMRERVYLAGGTVELQSGENGTLVRARLPRHAEDAASEVGAAAS